MSMIVLGIDPGINISGFGVLEYLDRHTRVITYGTVKTPSGWKIVLNIIYVDT